MEEFQTHHISYVPEITIKIPRNLHVRIHNHGTGTPKGVKKPREEEVILKKRRIIKIGKSYYISLPKHWLKRYKYPTSLLVLTANQILIINPDSESEIVADKDIRIVNPEHEAKIYEEVTKIARKVKL